MRIRHFMNIPRIREKSDELTTANTEGFKPGDHIVIQEKIDGANASIRYNAENGKMAVFSRKKELFDDTALKGFWSYAQALPAEEYRDTEAYVIFGEWLIPHTVEYREEAYGKWYVYDIYDTEKNGYLPQSEVKKFCERHHLIYVKTFYDGPFISWEHCRSFAGKSEIAIEQGEGVVVKNQTKLNCEGKGTPFVIKIVCENFSEVRKKKKKIKDPEKKRAAEAAETLVEQIVTSRRVEKEWMKMRDEGLVADMEFEPNIKILAKNLPLRIYQDCIKEEKEIVTACGEYFGKLCQKRVMKLIWKMGRSRKDSRISQSRK